MTIPENALADIHDRASLFAFLNDTLNWPTDSDDPFTYNGPTLDGDRCPDMRISQIVPFTAGDPFAVMLVESEGALKRSHLREILRRIREEVRNQAKYGGREMKEFLFLCAEEKYRAIRFARFTPKEKGAPKLSVFGWTKDTLGETRTVREHCLPSLDIRENLLGEIDWNACNWDKAWDVEKVTKEFFSEYLALFNRAEGMMKEIVTDANLFTTRLFNRLLFIHFLSKKGWLRYQGNTDYLRALWDSRDESANFYLTHLVNLFFSGLNNPQARDIMRDNPVLFRLIGEVPFLNGGLFHREQDEDPSPAIPNEICKSIITLFGRYNFTVMESTPDDEDVAVDPEMLGKLFEKVVTGRHENGSYYTPRPVVQFMCREALKGYLGGCEKLVEEHDASDVSVPEARKLLEKLSALKVVDPACGSGAYLLGMLHELHALHRLLDTRAEEATARDDYQRKLSIIRNNIYGVDLQEFAVQTARLRLWLSLAVEFEGDTPEPLPNLDFKIECGNSLLSPNPQRGEEPDIFRLRQIEDMDKMKADYADPYYPGDKEELKRDIIQLRKEIAAWEHHGKSVHGFDWRVEFAEAFAPADSCQTTDQRPQTTGFHIVLANPPYVRQELIKDQKPMLKSVYGDLFCGTADLYAYFYLRAIELLAPGGMLVFISSNKWFKAAYGKNLRRHISQTCQVVSIMDFGDLPVFESATAYPMIFIARKVSDLFSGITDQITDNKPQATEHRPAATIITQVKSLGPPYPDVPALVNEQGRALPADALCEEEWRFGDAHTSDRLKRMEAAGVPLGEYVQGKIYYGVKTGFNEAFVIDGAKRAELIKEDPRSAEIIKPLAVGKDIKRWRIEVKDRFLIFTKRGINIDNYPAVKTHLSQWKEELTPKKTGKESKGRASGNYEWYELQASPAETLRFEMPKIIYPVICQSANFAYDLNSAYTNDKAFIIPTNSPYLAAVLNSKTVWEFITGTCSPLQGGFYEMRRVYMERIPIPRATPKEQEEIAALAQKCLDAKGVGCEAWEAEIDAKVERLYFG
jgi:methylase of polypeptide subunit release factors